MDTLEHVQKFKLSSFVLVSRQNAIKSYKSRNADLENTKTFNKATATVSGQGPRGLGQVSLCSPAMCRGLAVHKAWVGSKRD